jgi:hypothetical protein
VYIIASDKVSESASSPRTKRPEQAPALKSAYVDVYILSCAVKNGRAFYTLRKTHTPFAEGLEARVEPMEIREEPK